MNSKALVLAGIGMFALAGPAHAAFISYGVSVTDFSTPNDFSFSFVTPIAPLTGINSYSFSGTISMTDATGDGVSASLFNLPEFWRLEAGDGSSAGWSILDDVGGTASLVGSGPFNFSAAGQFDCTTLVSCAALRLTFSFGLSGGGDGLVSSGTFSLSPPSVPEPGTLALLGLGLCGLGLSRRRAAN